MSKSIYLRFDKQSTTKYNALTSPTKTQKKQQIFRRFQCSAYQTEERKQREQAILISQERF